MKQVCCLLIDDDPDEHEFFLLALNDHFECSTCWCAHSVQEAIEQAAAGKFPRPDYIFMDWRLDGMDGALAISLLRQERAFKGSACVHIVATTSATWGRQLARVWN